MTTQLLTSALILKYKTISEETLGYTCICHHWINMYVWKVLGVNRNNLALMWGLNPWQMVAVTRGL